MEHIGAEVGLVMAVTQVAEDILFQPSRSEGSSIENSESEEDDLSTVLISLIKQDHTKQTGSQNLLTDNFETHHEATVFTPNTSVEHFPQSLAIATPSLRNELNVLAIKIYSQLKLESVKQALLSTPISTYIHI
ncbi:Uncharacterized protein APZ42_027784 [Daphnia magna]|uniref:Uncharacterized protein n=1 Tax=Daphnia magna TaxID=35525 RepID=A0A162D8E1_9CRUS|nr:Uncharacterized protein APZ42_027784 [Daphnia magna]